LAGWQQQVKPAADVASRRRHGGADREDLDPADCGASLVEHRSDDPSGA
jgi:hypothetical protein